MTIHISPETEARLRELAQREGRDVNAVVEAIIALGLETAAREREEAIKAVQEGLDDFASGRFENFAVSAARLRAKYNLPAHLTDEQLALVEKSPK